MNTSFLKLNIVNPEKDKLREAVKVLSHGGLVVLPTETVYGIGFDIKSEMARGKITDIKRERKEKPYSIAMPDFNWIEDYEIESMSLKRAYLIKDLLPGPLTFILNVGGKGKIGFRIPDNRITQDIITLFKKPIYLTSSNISDGVPALSFKEAVERLNGRVDLIINGGSFSLSRPSLVLDLTQNPVKILREGPTLFTEEVKKRFEIK